jgi:dihydrofolate reductase
MSNSPLQIRNPQSAIGSLQPTQEGSMRTVTYGAACSLDGFITARDGAIDWLKWSPDVSAIMEEYWKGVDAMLFGRKTWDFAQASGGGGGDEASDRGAFANVQSYLFSRTIKKAPPGVQLVSENAGEFVRDLKRKPGRGICVMSGGDFARSLFEAGVVDEVGLNIHPVLLGAGARLFQDPGIQVNLELKGCVYATYRVKRRAARAGRRAP